MDWKAKWQRFSAFVMIGSGRLGDGDFTSCDWTCVVFPLDFSSSVIRWSQSTVTLYTSAGKMFSFRQPLFYFWVFLLALAYSQSTSGYVGYNLTLEGDEDSVIYATDEIRPNAGLNDPDPDVYLNASVHVGTIDIEVDNLV